MRPPIPILRYRNARQAIDWLGDAFGFQPALVTPDTGDFINHARLTRGATMIMLASVGRPGSLEASFKTPLDSGIYTQSLYIPVDDPDSLYENAIAAGAKIIEPIADIEQLGRLFSCQDFEEHVWIFGSQNPWETLPTP